MSDKERCLSHDLPTDEGRPTSEVMPPARFRIERDELTGKVTSISGTLSAPVPETNGWEAVYHQLRPWENRAES